VSLIQEYERSGEGREAEARQPASFVLRLWSARRRILALTLAATISLTIILFRDKLAGLGALGYPGLFLVNFFSSATVILPMPGLALAFAAGSSLNPWLVGLAMGAGAAVGELTGYLAGYSGQGLVEDSLAYRRIKWWMDRYGLWVLFIMAAIPNPFFDVAGMVSGVLRIPVLRFFTACCAGNMLKATTIALIGAETIARLSPLLAEWLAR
jgi:membrane protein YqaA with SNARE-associated domain